MLDKVWIRLILAFVLVVAVATASVTWLTGLIQAPVNVYHELQYTFGGLPPSIGAPLATGCALLFLVLSLIGIVVMVRCVVRVYLPD